jgi:hypothetical protein
MPEMNAADILLGADQARLRITYHPRDGGDAQEGDVEALVPYNAPTEDLLRMATEAIMAGIPGIDADPNPDMTDYVVDRFPARDDMPVNRLAVRKKTPFGSR